jgi:membrane fusion protein (multidrug efflux system)
MTVRALAADRRRRAPALVGAVALAAGWLTWAVRAEVTVTIESVTATLVPERPAVVIAAAESGMLTSCSLTLGRHVGAGEVVAVVDRRDLLARLAALAARHEALTGEVTAVEAQQGEVRRAMAEERAAEVAGGGERGGRAGEAAAAAGLAGEVAAREARLAAAGLLAPAAAARSQAEAEERRQAAAAALLAAEAGRRRGLAAQADRESAAARLAGELARLRGEVAAVAGEARGVELELARRVVVAPVAGRLAAVAGAQVGGMVGRGAALATVVPDGPLEVEARFTAVAGAAVRVGQRGWVRLPGGFAPEGAAAGVRGRRAAGIASAVEAAGVRGQRSRALPVMPAAVPARVIAVSPGPLGNGRWEVRFAVDGDAAARWPLARPGEPCEVEVEVGRATPMDLALRGLGWREREGGSGDGAGGGGE